MQFSQKATIVTYKVKVLELKLSNMVMEQIFLTTLEVTTGVGASELWVGHMHISSRPILGGTLING